MLDPDRRRLLDSVLRKIQKACRDTEAGDKDAITAFIARFFQRLLSTIAVESRRGSAAASPRHTDVQNPAPQPNFHIDFESAFDITLNDQVSLYLRVHSTLVSWSQDDFLRILSMPIDNTHVDDNQYWLGQNRSMSGMEPQGELPFFFR